MKSFWMTTLSLLLAFPSLLLAQVSPTETPVPVLFDFDTPQGLEVREVSNLEAKEVMAPPCDCPACDAGDEGAVCPCCGKKKCTPKQKKAAKAKAAGAYKGVFYANDFSYLNDPCYQGCNFGDMLKRMNVGCCGKLDIGGQIRLRYHNEIGMKPPQRFQPATSDNFMLTRVRLFGNYQVNHWLRFYGETIYADSSGEDIRPRGIDENFMDFQNVFVDVKLTDNLTARVGRQELLYGSQRVLSPLDWANTRRKFEGIRALYKSGDWAIDGFFTHFVPVLPNDLDEADYNRAFYGMYGVYSGLDNATIDFYYLGFDMTALAPANGFSLHTIGGRVNGSCPCSDWMYEIEGATQFGQRAPNVNQGDGFVTAGVGRKLPHLPWSPTLWFYYDYASPNYNQLFPLAHKYLGFIDAVQRRNIESPNVQLTMKPCDKVNLLFWFYHFQSNGVNPVPSIGGTPAQNTGKYLGNELDCIAKYKISQRSDILFGYSHFWRGSKINNTQDADFFYTQWQQNF